ncbi:hypothetical protein [Bdellovibrio bacteriovorus]|uniref:hypothetical protein n=1 Tax=Bdellovibrio bacteriovorus TaxID=959 RepID=UPI00030A8834|nr:hypothetical protein [Bdellovibrio bacteriovorus]
MTKSGSFLHSRSLWVYYTLFFSGSLVLVYQALNWEIIGDSVNFLCLLFLMNGLLARRFIHILENSLLMTLGYILPLLIRNSLKLSYTEAPSIKEFLNLAFVSTTTTLVLGIGFSFLGMLLHHFGHKLHQMSRSRVTTNNSVTTGSPTDE